MSILIEANKIFREIYDAALYNSITNNSNICINGINFCFRQREEGIYINDRLKTIYIQTLDKNPLNYVNLLDYRKFRFNVFHAILRLLALKTRNPMLLNKKILECYLNAMMVIYIISSNRNLNNFVDFYDSKDFILGKLMVYSEDLPGNDLINYIRSLSNEEFEGFIIFIEQELTLCKIENVDLLSLYLY